MTTQLSLLPSTVSAVELAVALGMRHRPTDEQAASIEHIGEDGRPAPVLIVAGAGSGKTETMATRVAWLVANRVVRPEQVLGLTFTKKAAGELADRVGRHLAALRRSQLLGDDADDLLAGVPTVSTYHAYAGRLFAEHAPRVGREPGSRLLGEAATWQLAGRAAGAYDGPMDDVELALTTVTGRVRSLAADLAEHLVTPDALMAMHDRLSETVLALPRSATQKTKTDVYGETRDLLAAMALRRQLLPIVEAYDRLKSDQDALEFGDQVALAARIAQEHPVVGAGERARYPVVLLDEYQDTGHAQKVLLTALFGGGHGVTAVGDPCQSIYGWRGASAGNLRRFARDFPPRAGDVTPTLELRTSFRNGGRILAVANALSDPLRAEGVPVASLIAPPGREQHGRVVAARHLTVDDEARWLADSVADLLADPDRPYAPRDVAVLCRRRSQIPRIEDALRARSIPVEVSGLGGLLSRPEIVDVVSTLSVLTDPADGAAAARLLTGSRWRLGPRDLRVLGERARALTWIGSPSGATPPSELDPDHVDERSLVEAIDDLGPVEAYSTEGSARLSRLQAELRGLRRRLDQPLPDLVGDVIRTLRLDVEVASRPGAELTVGRGHLDRFLDTAAEFAQTDDDPSVRSFLAYLRAADEHERGLDTGRVGVPGDSVQILTVHGAKGLEWPVVVVPGLVGDVFPAKPLSSPDWCRSAQVLPFPLRGDRDDLPLLDLDRCTDQEQLRDALVEHRDRCEQRARLEERRLMYVATTRAADVLICSAYWWDGLRKPRAASVFFDEVVQVADASGILERGPDVDPPVADDVDPFEGVVRTATWPLDPLSEERRAALREAAGWMSTPAVLEPSSWSLTADRLVRERAKAERGRDLIEVPLPAQVSVSTLTALRRDPAELARWIRRPVPGAPAPLARRGTAFHSWLEQRFGGARMLDLDELPGSADADAAPDTDLEELQRRFLGSAWAERTPVEVEVPFDIVIGGLVVRGRMDAVFDGPDGVEVVDWKTGARPSGDSRAAAAVQLAAYLLAWHRLSGVPLERISAAFHYVREDHTERPADLMDEAALVALVRDLPSELEVDGQRGVVRDREA